MVLIEVGMKHFEINDSLSIKVVNWAWWDDGNALKIHEWLDKHTKLGADECCRDQCIYFLHEKELTLFVLRWQ